MAAAPVVPWRRAFRVRGPRVPVVPLAEMEPKQVMRDVMMEISRRVMDVRPPVRLKQDFHARGVRQVCVVAFVEMVLKKERKDVMTGIPLLETAVLQHVRSRVDTHAAGHRVLAVRVAAMASVPGAK